MNERSLILIALQANQLLANSYQLLKAMSQTQYLKMLEREIQKINEKIDLKILKGQEYKREARDHKLLLRKVRYHTRQNFLQRIISLFFHNPVRSLLVN